MTDLVNQLRVRIVRQLNLVDIKPEEIDPDTPLFDDGLGLDSIDALELMVILEGQYGLKIHDPREGRKILRTVRTMADYIVAHGKG